MSIDDATLMAFADGELPAARAAEVATAVAADAGLAAKVERFRAVRGKLAGALDGLAPSADLLERATAAEAARTAARPRVWGTALAASVAGLVVGAAAVVGLRPAGGDIGADYAARGALRSGLDRTPSGAAAGGVEPLYTVVAADGRACRAFRTTRGGARSYEGVACREGEIWRVLALAEAAPRAGGYSQASEDAPRAVEAALEGLRPGDPLPASAEQALIARRWAE
jgi:hypothetical protein